MIIPHVWLRRREVSLREVDTVTPDCWREQVVMKLLLEGIRPRSVVEAASSAALHLRGSCGED